MPILEFIVEGPPVSHQTRNKKKLREWMEKVQQAASEAWGKSPLSIPLKLTVVYYHEDKVVRLDNDNMVKPIQDALNQQIYEDDRLILDTQVRKTPIDSLIYPRGVSLVLLKGFSRGSPFLHIQVDPAPDHFHTL